MKNLGWIATCAAVGCPIEAKKPATNPGAALTSAIKDEGFKRKDEGSDKVYCPGHAKLMDL